MSLCKVNYVDVVTQACSVLSRIIVSENAEKKYAQVAIEFFSYKRYYINFHATLLDEIDPEYKLLRAFTDRELGCENLYSGAEFENIFPLTLFEAMHKEVGDEYQKRLNVRIYLLLLLEEINRIFDKRENIGYQTMETLPERMVAYVNAHLTEDEIKSMVGEQYAIVRHKAAATTEGIVKVYRKHLDKYFNRINNIKLG